VRHPFSSTSAVAPGVEHALDAGGDFGVVGFGVQRGQRGRLPGRKRSAHRLQRFSEAPGEQEQWLGIHWRGLRQGAECRGCCNQEDGKKSADKRALGAVIAGEYFHFSAASARRMARFGQYIHINVFERALAQSVSGPPRFSPERTQG
jgi:hypothetical protein